jgi:hypothetical protein
MNLRLHLEIVGVLLLVLGISHAFFGRYFGWPGELARVSLLTRQVFNVHTFFIGLLLVLLGACSFFYADALLAPAPLSRALLTGMAVFWLCRLLCQWFVYDRALWRGNRFRTVMHVAFSMLWIYAVLTYGGALYFQHRSLSPAPNVLRVYSRSGPADPSGH